jgi:hypothetical protein
VKVQSTIQVDKFKKYFSEKTKVSLESKKIKVIIQKGKAEQVSPKELIEERPSFLNFFHLILRIVQIIEFIIARKIIVIISVMIFQKKKKYFVF